MFEQILNSIEKDVAKLVYIHLFSDVGRISLIVLESKAKLLGVIKLLVTIFKIHKHFLKLVKNVLLRLRRFGTRINCICNRVSKVRNHEELLDETVHIAYAA